MCEIELCICRITIELEAPHQLGGSIMTRLMDNMPYSEFYKWLASPTFTGPVGLIAKIYLKEVTTLSFNRTCT